MYVEAHNYITLVADLCSDLSASAGCATSLEEDIAPIQAESSMDSRMRAVVLYRIERKTLLDKTRGLLRVYMRQS